MESNIKDMVLKFGADVCGIANINRFGEAPPGFHPQDIYPSCRSVIVFGLALPKGLLSVDPRIIYGHFNDSSFPEVDAIAYKTAKEVERLYQGCAIPIPSDGPYEYWDMERLEGRGILSMKHAAVLAGLGALGKSTMLLNEKYGNLLGLGAVLTELDLASDSLAENICLKGCNLCLKNCPTQALDGVSTNQKSCRPHAYGKNARGFEVVNCNKCRSVCPMRFGKHNKENQV
jgi:epoxyqueuosine reductase QueG